MSDSPANNMSREQSHEFGAYLLEMALLEFTRRQELAEQNAPTGRRSWSAIIHMKRSLSLETGPLFVRWRRMNVRH
jgi:hypothetical protein